MYFATVRAETLNPSLASSAWILRCPQKRFSEAIRQISVVNSAAIGSRPPVRQGLEGETDLPCSHRSTTGGGREAVASIETIET